jgi:hypothetical protein
MTTRHAGGSTIFLVPALGTRAAGLGWHRDDPNTKFAVCVRTGIVGIVPMKIIGWAAIISHVNNAYSLGALLLLIAAEFACEYVKKRRRRSGSTLQ